MPGVTILRIASTPCASLSTTYASLRQRIAFDNVRFDNASLSTTYASLRQRIARQLTHRSDNASLSATHASLRQRIAFDNLRFASFVTLLPAGGRVGRRGEGARRADEGTFTGSPLLWTALGDWQLPAVSAGCPCGHFAGCEAESFKAWDMSRSPRHSPSLVFEQLTTNN